MIGRLSDEEIRGLLTAAKTISVVGFSDDPSRPSHTIALYLASQGYDVTGVNPSLASKGVVAGIRVVSALSQVGRGIDIVDVFRRADDVMPVVVDAISVGARAIWFQDGVINEAAARCALDAGLVVVMDDCTMRRHRELGIPRT